MKRALTGACTERSPLSTRFQTTVALAPLVVLLFLGAACGATSDVVVVERAAASPNPEANSAFPSDPPSSGIARDVSFPTVTHAQAGPLSLHVAEWNELPVTYVELIVRSGSADDPQNLPGLAQLVGKMLEEGTRARSSAVLAEEVDFLGASLWVETNEDTTVIGMRALSEHIDQVLDILQDVAQKPLFLATELDKLRKRELDRLQLQEQDPNYLARRAFRKALYGAHPYGRIDTTPATLKTVRRRDLVRWHARNFVAANVELVVVGNVNAAPAVEKVARAFREFPVRAISHPSRPVEGLPNHGRRILIVNRPDSVQSVIVIGNLALQRNDANFIPLQVANQVLGGSAASRLFMDLREQRSLTYGAYSGISEFVGVAPFAAKASVRTDVTAEAVSALFEHLDRIVAEPVPDEELENARRYLSDSFPLQIDTPGKIAGLISEQLIFGLDADYWQRYRSRVQAVDAAQALAAARDYIHPDKALVVLVGRAASFARALTAFGPVTVLRPDGSVEQELEQGTPPDEPAEPTALPENEPSTGNHSTGNHSTGSHLP